MTRHCRGTFSLPSLNPLSMPEADVFDRTIVRYKNIDIIDAHPDHADYLADKLRSIDKVECMALGYKPREALMLCFEHDRVTLTVTDKDKKPLAMFGIGEDEEMPYIWLLGTEDFPKVARRDIVEHSKTWIRELLKITGGAAGNIVHCYNRKAVRWLEWVGASFTQKLSIKGEPFYQFILINKDVIDEKYV